MAPPVIYTRQLSPLLQVQKCPKKYVLEYEKKNWYIHMTSFFSSRGVALLSLDQIACQCSISPRSLGRLFRVLSQNLVVTNTIKTAGSALFLWNLHVIQCLTFVWSSQSAAQDDLWRLSAIFNTVRTHFAGPHVTMVIRHELMEKTSSQANEVTLNNIFIECVGMAGQHIDNEL